MTDTFIEGVVDDADDYIGLHPDDVVSFNIWLNNGRFPKAKYPVPAIPLFVDWFKGEVLTDTMFCIISSERDAALELWVKHIG